MVPSASTMVMPMKDREAAPNRRRRAPLSFAAMMPPTVARSGIDGIERDRWPWLAQLLHA